jgi:hypothetical protein
MRGVGCTDGGRIGLEWLHGYPYVHGYLMSMAKDMADGGRGMIDVSVRGEGIWISEFWLEIAPLRIQNSANIILNCQTSEGDGLDYSRWLFCSVLLPKINDLRCFGTDIKTATIISRRPFESTLPPARASSPLYHGAQLLGSCLLPSSATLTTVRHNAKTKPVAEIGPIQNQISTNHTPSFKFCAG